MRSEKKSTCFCLLSSKASDYIKQNNCDAHLEIKFSSSLQKPLHGLKGGGDSSGRQLGGQAQGWDTPSTTGTRPGGLVEA